MKKLSFFPLSGPAVLLVIIIFCGAFLRMSHFDDLTRFNNDQVRDAKIFDNYFSTGEFPLLGPKAGGTAFQLGPSYYLLSIVSGYLFGTTPPGYSFFIPLLATASIALFYFLFRRIFSPEVTILLTFLYAVSFFAIKYSRFGWNPNALIFFLLAFYLLLLAEKDATRFSWLRAVTVGIVTGIALQLHTTLLVILPLLFLLWYGFLYFQEKKKVLWSFLLAGSIIFIIQLPLIISDIQTHGQNSARFLEGSSKKTTAVDMGATANFLLQGTAYVLTGVEPTHSWEKPLKLVRTGNWWSLGYFIATTVFFVGGLTLLGYSLRQEKDLQRKEALWLLSGGAILSTLLFVLIGEEINIRFFSLILFVPFLLLGFWLSTLQTHLRSSLIFIGLLVGIGIPLGLSQAMVYDQVYSFSDPTVRESLYGGISYGEARDLAHFMKVEGRNHNLGTTLLLLDFEHKRSLEYTLAKDHLVLSSFGEEQNALPRFLITKNETREKALKNSGCCLEVLAEDSIGRYTILLLQPKS